MKDTDNAFPPFERNLFFHGTSVLNAIIDVSLNKAPLAEFIDAANRRNLLQLKPEKLMQILALFSFSISPALSNDLLIDNPWVKWTYDTQKVFEKKFKLPQMQLLENEKFGQITCRFWFDKQGMIHDLKFEELPKSRQTKLLISIEQEIATALKNCQPLELPKTVKRDRYCAFLQYTPLPRRIEQPDIPVLRFGRQSCYKGDI